MSQSSSSELDCDLLDQLPCDVNPYFDCLRSKSLCVDDELDVSLLQKCAHLLQCVEDSGDGSAESGDDDAVGDETGDADEHEDNENGGGDELGDADGDEIGDENGDSDGGEMGDGDGDGDSDGGEIGDGDGDGDGDSDKPCLPGHDRATCPSGEKCIAAKGYPDAEVVEWAECVPVDGTLGIGAECTRNGNAPSDDCGPGLWCMTGCLTCGSSLGFCTPLCDMHTLESQRSSCQEDFGLPDEFYCIDFEGYYVTPYCLPTCHPLEDDCPPGTGCYPLGAGHPALACFDWTPGSSDGEAGSMCEWDMECRPGHHCRYFEDLETCEHERCCARICDLDADDPAEVCEFSGEVCVPQHYDPLPGKENVGYCGVPNARRMSAAAKSISANQRIEHAHKVRTASRWYELGH